MTSYKNFVTKMTLIQTQETVPSLNEDSHYSKTH